MGLLRGRGTLDPRYFRAGTRVIEGDMTALIKILRPNDGTAEPVWSDEAGEWIEPADTLIWRGMARIQPNKDWRARNREFAFENTAEHAVRVQLNVYKNFMVPREQWPAPAVDIQHADIVEIERNPNDPILEKYVLSVRNGIPASDNWHRTLLCDANLGSRIGE